MTQWVDSLVVEAHQVTKLVRNLGKCWFVISSSKNVLKCCEIELVFNIIYDVIMVTVLQQEEEEDEEEEAEHVDERRRTYDEGEEDEKKE